MNKTKILQLSVVLLIGILFLAGCKRNEQDNENTSQQVTLIWWNLFESQKNVQPLIDAFQDEHPNVIIQYKQQGVTGGVGAYKNLLDNALTDDEAINDPDIFTIENTWVGSYEQYIATAPTDVLDTNSLADFYSVVQSDFATGSIKGLPLYVDTLAVIYNKDKLIEAGYSVPDNDWNEFKTQAINLTTRDSSGNIASAGFAGASGNNVQFNFDIFNLLMLQNGVDLNSNTTLAGFSTNSDVLDSFSFYNAFNSGQGSWNSSQKLDIAAFLEGRLAMFIAPSWRLNDVLIYNEQYNLNLDIGIAPIPQLSGSDNIHWATYWGQTVSKASANSKIAWEFIKFITESEQLKVLDQTVKENGRMVGIFYPRLSMASEISEDENLRVFSQAIPFAKSWYMRDGYAMEQEFNEFFSDGEKNYKSLETEINSIRNST